MTDPNQPASEPTPSEPISSEPQAAAVPAAPPASSTAGHYASPQSAGDAVPQTFPGKTLGIVSIPVAVFFQVIGIILGFVARSQSKAAGFKNTPATIGIIVGFVLIVVGIIVAILLTVFVFNVANSVCDGQAPGVYELTDGGTITCN